MKVFFTKKAEQGLERIFEHVEEYFTSHEAEQIRKSLRVSILKPANFPELGAKIAGQADRRVFYINENAVIYEIIIKKEPIIVVRNIRPRRTE